MAFPDLLRNQSTSVLLGALAQVETERADLMIRRMPADSDVQVLTRRIRDIETQLQGIAETFLQSLTNQVSSLESEAAQSRAQLDALPEKELQVARGERDTKVLADLSQLVHTRLKESEISRAAGDPTARLVDAAVSPAKPVRPRPVINLALSLLLGTMIGIGAALVREHGDRSVRSRADALATSGLPVLGAMPHIGLNEMSLPWRKRLSAKLTPGFGDMQVASEDVATSRRNGSAIAISSLLITQPDVPGAYTEAFNQLFANLALVYRQRAIKTVVFTSPLPGEGKTLTAINFALTGASRGMRVLLIDADLRCGMVSSVIKCRREPGFAELLEGTAQMREVVRRVSVGESGALGVIPSGALPKVPGRVLTLEKVQEVLAAVTPKFDFVVIDTPPINLLADAALLASAADAVLLVVRAGHTQADDLRYAMDQLEAAHAPVIGTLLNDIDLRRNSRDDSAYRYLAAAEQYHAGAV